MSPRNGLDSQPVGPFPNGVKSQTGRKSPEALLQTRMATSRSQALHPLTTVTVTEGEEINAKIA